MTTDTTPPATEEIRKLKDKISALEYIVNQRRGLVAELRQEFGITEDMDDDAELKQALAMVREWKERIESAEEALAEYDSALTSPQF